MLNSNLQNYYDLLVPETLIPNNSDLNNYTTPGQYYTSNSASSQTIEHSPYTAGGFKLSVEATVTQNRIIQILKPGALSNSSMYYRIGINQSGWEFSDWEKLTTNADIQYGIVTVNAAQNETTEFSVTFPRQFSSTPQVVVTVATSGPKDNIASVLSITTNGFKGYLYRGGVTANMSIRWIAIGY